MKKIKALRAAVIMLALIFTAANITYADPSGTQLTDIDNSWAKQNILNVYNKGLMNGVSAGKFGPKENVKQYDVIVSIARMIDPEKDTDTAPLAAKYKKSVLDKFNVPEYARESVALCLEKGIVKDAEVGAFSIKPYATKQDVSVYLGRAFGVTVKENDIPKILAYKDAMLIGSLYRPYVKYLADKGIVSATGDANGMFNPNEILNRETFAKMLDLSNRVYEREKLGLGTDDGSSGDAEDAVPAETTPEEATPADTAGNIPDAAEPVVEQEIPADASIEATAYVDEPIPEYGNLAVFVGIERRVYSIAENAVCTLDGSPSQWWKLKKSDEVTLYTSGGKVVKIVAESKIRKTVGKLVSIDTSEKTVLAMETEKGEVKKYTITSKTIVIKDAKPALWQELKPGNSLTITTSYDELLEINADGVKSTDKGVIESISFSRMAPPKIVITALDGSQNAYYASKGIEIEGTGNDVYSLRPGMQVDVSIIDDEISKISVVNTAKETTAVEVALSGQIKQVDEATKLVVLEVFDKAQNSTVEKRVFLTEETRVGDAYLNILSINDLKVGQLVEVRGTGSLEGVYAKVVQIK